MYNFDLNSIFKSMFCCVVFFSYEYGILCPESWSNYGENEQFADSDDSTSRYVAFRVIL